MALPPGPKLPPIVQTLRFLLMPTTSRDQLTARYGDIYTQRFAFFGAEVTISDPALIKQVFTGDPDVFHAGEANTLLSGIIGDRSLLRLDGEAHLRERRRMMPPFHGERMQAYGERMREIAEHGVGTWKAGEEISLQTSMQRITMEIMLGVVFGLTETPRHAELRAQIAALMARLTAPLGFLLLAPTLDRHFGHMVPWRGLKRAIRRVDDLLFAEIKDRRAEVAEPANPRRIDVLSMLLEVRDEHGDGMTDAELRDELITLLIAGHENTATAMCWAFEQILRHPDVGRRLVAELSQAAPDDIAGLDYLDATIKEVLRLRPVAGEASRLLKKPVTLRGYEIPAGTLISPSIYNTHRRPDLYPDPLAFRPERFLGKKPDPYTWFPFGGGARRCLGMAFALYEMKVILAVILRRVRLRLVKAAPLRVVLRSFLFAPEGGTRVVVEGLRERAAVKEPCPASPGQ